MIKNKTLSASEFNAKCLKIVENLGPDGMVITKRGHPVARVLPITYTSNAETIGLLKGKIVVKGNLFSTGIKWHAES